MKLLSFLFTIFFVLVLSTCHHKNSQFIPVLPLSISNNAVAMINTQKGFEIYSFNGLLTGKTWKDITNNGYRLSQGSWKSISMPELSLPVLASTAVNIGTDVYLIGGYTVNQKGEEKSVADIFKLDTVKQEWSVVTKMPVPVDDTVALTYANRYIYLISGWHDVDNVSIVQVYDVKLNKWFTANPYPAPAVFGHAGGIVENTLVICDGVKVVKHGKSKEFVASPICQLGVINPTHPEIIDWSDMPHHSQTAYYRMAATGDIENSRFIFAGGSDNPYNYDGIGYNKVPSEASNLVFEYDSNYNVWKTHSDIIGSTMDHRALLTDGHWFYIVGGMKKQQKISNEIMKFTIDNE